MLVKNTATGEKIERSSAYIVEGGRRMFFSNKEEADKFFKDKANKEELVKIYLQLFRSVDFSNTLYVIARKHVNSLMIKYELPFLKYMFDHIDSEKIGASIKFTTQKARYMYLYVAITNKLSEHYKDYLKQKEKAESQSRASKLKSERVFEISKQTNKNKKANINDFI